MTALETPWMTVKEVAAYSRRSGDAVYIALQSGELKASQSKAPKGRWNIHRDDVDAWLRGETSTKSSPRNSKLKAVK
ncbi:DNA-binding protein [Rhodococcus sp. AD45-ID]|uniref:helix-turn-helix domain-containing protein n=1 Tax=unclassified Rhodococcus (in: high G+C Gram-positive bacteria) TaxID=192944 RepID=UPI0005D34DF9|nr:MULTISPECIES: helix-turn-helix domain-containing protein [unclassified Rhodococcus (in: high G+C Gram-positive bacteria)]KJF21923.1 DNA binding domain, excisionase family [Rhodococcus sp. AD45]PSR39624.1 DNA-binding protein [Rhodococcus sp. AD45-ID]